MKLKVGDVVEFKKYEDMNGKERYGIKKEFFPKFGEVEIIFNITGNIKIKGSPQIFNRNSIDYVISHNDVNKINDGDEVLIKATVNNVLGDSVWLNPVVFKDDVVKVLKRKEEHFIVQEDHYGMYVNGSEVLVVNKDDAKVFNSRDEANKVAADMHLNAWEVIPYDA